MILLAVGTMIYMSSIFFMSSDHRGITPSDHVDVGPGKYPALDVACNGQLWMYVTGFCVAYGTLFVKLWRIHRMFFGAIGGQPKRGKKSESWRISMVQLGCVCGTGIGLLFGLTVHTPLYYNVLVVRTDAQSGFVLESRGECHADDMSGARTWSFWVWFSALVTFHFSFLVLCAWVVYKIKDVPSKFNEGKYIAFSLANHFQVTLLAMLLTFFINDKPDRVLLIKSISVLGSSNITLTLMFAPKIASVHDLVTRHSEFAQAVKMSEDARSHRSATTRGTTGSNAPRPKRASSLNSDDPVPVGNPPNSEGGDHIIMEPQTARTSSRVTFENASQLTADGLQRLSNSLSVRAAAAVGTDAERTDVITPTASTCSDSESDKSADISTQSDSITLAISDDHVTCQQSSL